MNQYFLTIAVPTYNRSECLELLLSTLLKQTQTIPDVEILVIDNASPDDTYAVLKRLKTEWPQENFRFIQNKTNLGLDGNASECFEQARGGYVWIFGDDDLPTCNAIDSLLPVLKRSMPDLLYIESAWHRESLDRYVNSTSPPIQPKLLTQERFSKVINTFFTFLTGVIVNKKKYLELAGIENLRRYAGTSLGLMEWVYTLLNQGSNFVYVSEPMINARAGHAGGYKLFEVFGTNLELITRKALSPKLADALLERHVSIFLPVLVWDSRFSTLGDFESEKIFKVLKTPFNRFILFWLIIAPITAAPKPVARLFHIVSKVLRFTRRSSDKLAIKFSRNV